MSNLVQVAEHVLGVIFEEEIGQFRVLHRPFPRRRRHHGMHVRYAARRALTHTLMLAPPDVHDGHHSSTIGQLDLWGERRTITHTSREQPSTHTGPTHEVIVINIHKHDTQR